MARDRGGIDDLSFLLASLEFLRGSLDTPENAIDVDPEDLLNILGRVVGDCPDLDDSGVVDDHVEAVQLFLCVVDGGMDLITLGHVRGESRRLAANLPYLARNRGGLVVIDVHKCDIRSVAGQPQDNRATYPLPRAGNQCNLPVDAHHCLVAHQVRAGCASVSGYPACRQA